MENRETGSGCGGMPASASLSALALGEGDVEGEWRHSQETRFHCRETRSIATRWHTATTRPRRRLGRQTSRVVRCIR